MENKPLLQRLLDAGYPKDQVFHHDSDLYVFVTDLTETVLDQWLSDHGWTKAKNDTFFVDRFIDQITGRQMYDIAFQYNPAAMEQGGRAYEI